MKNWNKILCVFALLLFGGCESLNSDTTTSGSIITLQTLAEDGTLTLTIPQDVFGVSDFDLEGTTLDIYVNNELQHKEVIALDHYDPHTNAVVLTLPSLHDGDILEVVIHQADGYNDTYTGLVSEDSPGQAEIITLDENQKTQSP